MAVCGSAPQQCRLYDHPRADGVVIALVDDDEGAGGPVVFVGGDEQRLGEFEAGPGDVIYS